MKERTILHSDVNNFFASVECAHRPELKDKPVAVAGNPEKRTGVILAKNELAKKAGVQTGQVIWEAKNVCPDLVVLLPHYDLYQEICEKLHEFYLNYTDFVEPLGLDECWLDVTDSLRYLNKTGKQLADELRGKIAKQFNFTVSVGVSFSKLFAKLGSDMKKPNATTVIAFNSFKEQTYSLPLNSIVGIGRKLQTRFEKSNIMTIGDFVTLSDEYLNSTIGITLVNLKHELLGDFNPPVLNYYHLPPPKSIGNGTTTLKDILKREDCITTLTMLAEKVASRLLKHKVLPKTLSVSIKTNKMECFHKSMKIPPTRDVTLLVKNATRILDAFWKYDQPVRSIRLRTSNFISDEARQISMFEEREISPVIDIINEKYGGIYLASDKSKFLNTSKNPHE